MKNFLPLEYKKNEKLKINHSYLVEQFADYSKIFKEVEKVVKKGDYTNRKPAISSLRRNLQRTYLKNLSNVATLWTGCDDFCQESISLIYWMFSSDPQSTRILAQRVACMRASDRSLVRYRQR